MLQKPFLDFCAMRELLVQTDHEALMQGYRNNQLASEYKHLVL